MDEDGKVNGIMYQEGLPLVDEGAYTFSIFCDDSSESGEFIMLDEFKKQTNVDVDLKIYPYETATERPCNGRFQKWKDRNSYCN